MNLEKHFPLFTKLARLIGKYFPLHLWVFLILYISINNGLFWISSALVYSERYIIVLEYIWILPLLCLRQKWSTILFSLAYIAIYIIDLLYWIKQFYHYDNLIEFIGLLRFILIGPKLYWLFIAIFLIYLVFSLFLIIKYVIRFTSVKMIIPIGFLYLIFWIFFFDYRGANLSGRYNTTGMWGSYYETIRNLKYNRELFWQVTVKPDFYAWPNGGVLQRQIEVKNPPKKILFILNESWGIFVHGQETINSSIYASLQELSNVRVIAKGENPAENSTIKGELRELCNLKAKSSAFAMGPFEKFQQCVPMRLQKQGYQVLAFHGATAKMYERQGWYPQMGLQNAHFFPDFSNIQQCHSYPGACDFNIVHDIAAANKQAKDKSFIYWLTLNTHHPYSEKDIQGEPSYDCQQPLFKGRQEACRNLNLQHQFFQILANEIKAGAFKDTEIVVVGDHSPPIIFDEFKDSFKPDSVPFIHFRVN